MSEKREFDLEGLVSVLRTRPIENWNITSMVQNGRQESAYFYKFDTRGFFIARYIVTLGRGETYDEEIKVRVGGGYTSPHLLYSELKQGEERPEVNEKKGTVAKRAYVLDTIYKPKEEPVLFNVINSLITYLDEQAVAYDSTLQNQAKDDVTVTLAKWLVDPEGMEKKWEDKAKAREEKRSHQEPYLIFPEQTGFVQAPGSNVLVPGSAGFPNPTAPRRRR